MCGAGRSRGGIFVSGRDSRLERLIFLSAGVYAIALTLLAVVLVLPESAVDLHGDILLESLLESWPKVLAFLTSFTVSLTSGWGTTSSSSICGASTAV